MSKNQTNTNLLIKQKFENYTPVPPGHVWEGIQAGIVVKPAFFMLYWKSIVASAIILSLIAAGFWYLIVNDSNYNFQQEFSDTNIIQNNTGKEEVSIEQDKSIDKSSNAEFNPDQRKNEEGNTSGFDQNKNTKPANHGLMSVSGNSKKEDLKNSRTNRTETNKPGFPPIRSNELASTNGNNDLLVISDDSNENSGQEFNKIDNVYLGKINTLYKFDIDDNYLSLYSGKQAQTLNAISINNLLDTELSDFTKNRTKWSIGFYFAAEMMLNNFDSIEMLTNYSFAIEPTYYINKYLFIRFGIGANYSRDRGFAKLDYLSNDLLGTYEYVYDITFDSVDGVVVPTYHTTTAEVWDTVRHLDINSISNNYVYLQVPALFGYYNAKSRINWYVYGGPAFNLMLTKQIEKPLEGLDYIDLNNLQTELPERSPYYFQLWVGAGIEYKAGKNLGVAIEPSYKYYFKNVFNNLPYSNSGISGLSLRVGLVYTIQ